MNTEIEMAEINNNIPTFGRNIEKLDNFHKEQKSKSPNINEPNKKDMKYIPDTGVLGRSQVKSTKGGDVQRSVDEAVLLAQKNPALMCGCESVFDCIYRDCLAQGMNESDAYMKALLAEEEFLQVGSANNR